MQVEALQLTVNSKGAQADLGALSRALDQAGTAFQRMETKFAAGGAKTDAALGRALTQAEKTARVAAMLGKIKVDGSSTQSLLGFAHAVDALGRARMISDAKVKTLRDFARIIPNMRAPSGAARMSEFLNAIGNAKTPSATSVRNLTAFLRVLSSYKGSAATRSTGQLTAFMTALAGARAPSQSTITRLHSFLNTLATAKTIPNAQKIANDLLYVAQAAQRASAAFAALPRSMQAIKAPVMSSSRSIQMMAMPRAGMTSAAGNAMAGSLRTVGAEANGAVGGIKNLHGSLGMLNERFRLGYQLGTVFSAMFASFTIGQFVRGVYESGLQIQKLGKAMLFTTGTFAGAQQASGEYMKMAYGMGLSIDKTIESYGRFMISSTAAGVSASVAKRTFEGVSMALQVVGASTEQTQYAFYGLTEMLQKGEVMSKELNRQLGQQIPGSAVAAAAALTHLTGKVVSVAQMFKMVASGKVQSSTFAPAYAEELRKMYEPLMAMAQKRPDLAMNRLNNAFKIFTISVGQSGFMSQVGRGMDGLAGKIVQLDAKGQLLLGPSGFPMLTTEAQKLADKIGGNLATAVHTAVSFLKMLLDHLPQVVTAIKVMIGLKLAFTFMDWANGAHSFATGVLGIGTAAKIAKAELAALNAEKAGVGAIAAGATALKGAKAIAGAEEAAMGASGLSATVQGVGAGASIVAARGAAGVNSGLTIMGAPGLGVRKLVGESSRATFGLRGATLAGEEVATIDMTAKATGSLEGAAAKGASGMMKLLGVVGRAPFMFGAVGVAVAALGGAYMLYADKTTVLGDKAVKVKDIVGGGFAVLGRQIGSWAKVSFPWLDKFGAWFEATGRNSGEVVANMVTAFVWLADRIGAIFKGMGEAMAAPFKLFAKGVEQLKHHDLAGAAGTFALAGLAATPVGLAVNTSIGAFKGGPSWSDIHAQVVKEAQDHSTAIKKTEGDALTSDVDARTRALTEAKLAANKAAQQVDRDAAEADARAKIAKFGLLGEPLNFDSITKKLMDTQAVGAKNTADAQKSAAQRQIDASRVSANINVEGSKEAAQIQIEAAKEAAAALRGDGGSTGAANAPNANVTTPYNHSFTSGKFSQKTPANLDNLFVTKAADAGLDPEILRRFAYRESGDKANAYNAKSRAAGLFQFLESTWKTTMPGASLDDRYDPAKATDAFIKLTKANQAQLQARLGRMPTAGELYEAHFLGAYGAGNLIQGLSQDPNANAINTIQPGTSQKADHIRKLIVAANPMFKGGSASVAEIDKNLLATMGESRGAITPKQVATGDAAGGSASINAMAAAASTDASDDKKVEQLQQARDMYLEILTKGDPAKAADLEEQKWLGEYNKVVDIIKKYQDAGGGLVGGIDLGVIQQAHANMLADAHDKSNPLGKTNRENLATFGVDKMRAQGLEDQANWQEKINALDAEHFVYDQKQLEIEHQKFMIGEQQKRQLRSEIELRKTLNEVAAKAFDRTHTGALDRAIYAGVDAAALPNESHAAALARLQTENGGAGIRNIVQGATANVAEDSTAAMKTMQDSLKEMQDTYRLNPTAKALRDDYKQTLKDISGSSATTLAGLEADATAAQRAMAQGFADAKAKMENENGFQRWADQLEPFAKRMNDIKANFVDTLSSGITDALSGDKVDWRAMAHNLAKQVLQAQVNTGLQGIIQKVTGGPATPEQAQMTAAAQQTTAAQTMGQAAQSHLTAATSLNTAGQALLQVAQMGTQLGGGVGPGSLGMGQAANDNLALSNNAGAFSSAGLSTALPDLASTLAGSGGTHNWNALASAGAATTHDWGSLAAAQGGNTNLLGYPDLSAGLTPTNPIIPLTNAMAGFGSSDLSSALPSDILATALPGGFKAAGAGGGGGLMGSMAGAAIPALLAWLTRPKAPPQPIVNPLNGVIGQSSTNTVDGIQVAAHANLVGSLLSTAAGMAGSSGFGAPGGNLTSFFKGGGSMGQALGNFGNSLPFGQQMGSAASGMGSFLSSLFGGFSEGGYSNAPVHRLMRSVSFHDAPRFREGTANTSNEIPAILHPNEAVVPLSRGRAIPIEGDMGSTTHVTVSSPINIYTPDANSFRQSQSSLQSKQNMTIRRAAMRNLSAAA